MSEGGTPQNLHVIPRFARPYISTNFFLAARYKGEPEERQLFHGSSSSRYVLWREEEDRGGSVSICCYHHAAANVWFGVYKDGRGSSPSSPLHLLLPLPKSKRSREAVAPPLSPPPPLSLEILLFPVNQLLGGFSSCS